MQDKQHKKKHSKIDRQRLLVQIFCFAIAILMILGVLISALPFAMLQVSAHDDGIVTELTAAETEETAEDAESTDSASAEGSEDAGTVSTLAAEAEEDLLLRIGLMYGSSVTSSFAVSADNGFKIGHVSDSDDTFLSCYATQDKKIAVCRDGNLALDADGYYVLSSTGVIIGGYHLELPTAYENEAALLSAVSSVNAKLTEAGLYSSLVYAFGAYVNGRLCVRIGDFGSGSSASLKAEAVAAATGETPTVINPDTAAVTVLSTEKNMIVFEYTSKDGMLGVQAADNADGSTNTIMTPAQNTYEGVFAFGRYQEGISLTNIIGLEAYVAGVLPYEISSSWSYECVKAFAVIVRSYTLANRSKHTSYGIDLCNKTDCQVYMGTKAQNATILRAVEETRGMVITYNNKICSTMYSAVTGGCTVNVEQVWNGTAYPYLRAVETPWEDYASHRYGEWVSQVSGSELYTYLSQTKGYTQLKGEIVSVDIEEFAENSTYVYKLKITDIYGNSVTLKGTDIIRTTLGRYLNSANFAVAKDGVIAAMEGESSMLMVRTADGDTPLVYEETEEKKTTQILTADGIVEIDITDGCPVLGADGTVTMHTADNSDTIVYDIPEEAQALLDDKDNDNFIFIGKGWGHGCGISQWGAKNMAEAGATYDEIIHAYFTDVTLQPYTAVLKK